MGLAIIVLDGDVLALGKPVLMQAIARLFIAEPALVVINHPGPPAGPAGPMDQDTLLLALIYPEAADPAVIPFHCPFVLVEMPLRIERRRDVVAVTRTSLRKLLAA